MWCLYNNEIIQEEQLCISSDDRGFQYGDGIFETLRYQYGKILFAEDHFSRLKAGTEVLKLNTKIQLNEILLKINHLAKLNDIHNARVKIYIWRKPGGLFAPESSLSNNLITFRPFTPSPSIKEKVVFAKHTTLAYSSISKCKTLSSVPYILAGLEKKECEADEIIIMDNFGHIAECLTSNLFWIDKNNIFTPSISSGCIDGITRKKILTFCKERSYNIQEGLFDKEKLISSESIFTSNISGLSKISHIEGITYNTSNIILNEILSYFNQLINP